MTTLTVLIMSPSLLATTSPMPDRGIGGMNGLVGAAIGIGIALVAIIARACSKSGPSDNKKRDEEGQ